MKVAYLTELYSSRRRFGILGGGLIACIDTHPCPAPEPNRVQEVRPGLKGVVVRAANHVLIQDGLYDRPHDHVFSQHWYVHTSIFSYLFSLITIYARLNHWVAIDAPP